MTWHGTTRNPDLGRVGVGPEGLLGRVDLPGQELLVSIFIFSSILEIWFSTPETDE